jgi:glycogen phosphorylase
VRTDVSPEHAGLMESLTGLAMDLHWSWNHTTDKIWRKLDPVLWQLTHNPLVVLQTVSVDRITEMLNDESARHIINDLVEAKLKRAESPAWFQNNFPSTALKNLAFFSMEFMLSEALPVYSGGLGNVAGDHLKTASDLGVPVTGVGLLYQQGYSRQVIFSDGTQNYVAPYNEPGQLPVTPLRFANGEWLRIEIKFRAYSIWLRTWKVQVGRTSLLLLDSNDPANFPVHRGITSELYGGGAKERLMQELILGIGGWRLLKTLGLQPEVCHLNEGHSAFVIVERAVAFMDENNVPFQTALTVTRSGNIFTTHTAIGAGFDRFPPWMIEQFLGHYITGKLKITLKDFLSMGRQDPLNDSEPFNTGFFAMNGSSYVNGVSKLHGEVSRNLFSGLFKRWPIEEVPVKHITNGVHMPTWDSPEADKLWTAVCGKERWLGSLETLGENIKCIPAEKLWELRNAGHKNFITFLRERYARQLATTGAGAETISEASTLFDPAILTLGFAKRFVKYKRPGLLLKDKQRLKNILSDPQRPVQLVIAGKAHRDDVESQQLITEWVHFINDFNLGKNIVFISDYDMLLTEEMVQGVDVWINTPRRPWEACGTSGMKILVNGGLNLSAADGWWDEAYSPEYGWSFGKNNINKSEEEQDDNDAVELYGILENGIIPAFYERDENDIPIEWVNRMRNSMAALTMHFSSARSMQEYTERFYIPAAVRYNQRSKDKGTKGIEFENWKTTFSEKWKGVYFGNTEVVEENNNYRITVPVFLNGLEKTEVEVEIYASAGDSRECFIEKMKPLADDDPCIYTAMVPGDIPVHHYTPRIFPRHIDVSIPLELSLILWQH